jgi:hypothetical protein
VALAERVQITTVQARRFLRVDDTEDDALIEPMIEAAIEDVEGLIGHDFTRVDPDTNTIIEDPVPAKITVAALRMLGSLYEWRDSSTEQERLGDEAKTRRPPEEERGELLGYLYQYRKNPGL